MKQIKELLDLARIGVDTGRYARAQELLHQALKLDPQCQTALALLQGVEERLNRMEPAVATPERAAPFNPSEQDGTSDSRPMASPDPRSGATYGAQHLAPGEETIYRARPHWVILIAPLFILFAGLALYGLFIRPFIGNDRYLAAVSTGVNAFFVLAAMVVATSGVVRYTTTEFILTNKRIIARQGLLWRHSLELFLSQVESIRIEQPLLGQVLQYGTVVVTGSGGTKERFSIIANPYELRRRVNQQLSGIAQGK